MIRSSPLLLVALVGCSVARPPVHPVEENDSLALKAIRCGDLTALWRGKPSDGSAPISFFVEALSFRFADGSERAWKPVGTVAPAHVSFEIFSPDCAYVALAQDSYGPYHLVPVAGLADYLEGKRAPLILKPPPSATAPILTEQRWLSATRFQFFASCCGGVEVFDVDVAEPSKPERVYFAAQAPSGIRRVGDGFEPIR